MKKLKKVILSLSVIGVALTLIAINSAKSYIYTLSDFVKDTDSISVYIPDGKADDYISITGFTMDGGHRIWEYELNEKESAAIDVELNNGVWMKLTEDEYKHIESAFFGNNYLSLDMSDSVYGCLFDCKQEKFVLFSEDDNSLVGLDKVLFLYDSEEKTYLCVHKCE